MSSILRVRWAGFRRSFGVDVERTFQSSNPSISTEYKVYCEWRDGRARERHSRDCLHVHTCRMLQEPQRTSAPERISPGFAAA